MTDGFNVIARRSKGTYSDEELLAIEEDFHFAEVRALMSEGRSGPPRQRYRLLEDLRLRIFVWSFLLAPNHQAALQIEHLFSSHFGNFKLFHELALSDRVDERLTLCKHLIDQGIHCRAYDDAVAPSVLELARMSRESYLVGKVGQPADVEGFKFFRSSPSSLGEFGALIYKRENQVVIVFRGTERELNSYVTVSNLVADVSWILEASTRELATLISESVDLVISVHSEYPEAELFLTGHSLGGALAQMLAEVTKLPAIAFDAPGAATRLSELSARFARLRVQTFSNTGANLNYRLLGDPISMVGSPIGEMCTIFRPRPNPPSLSNHDIALLIIQLSNARTPVAPYFVGTGNPAASEDPPFPIGQTCPAL